jgi:hypothetical protein
VDQADRDYADLRMRIMAHQVLLCSLLVAHPDKVAFAAAFALASNQMQAQLLPSSLEDSTLEIFDQEVNSVLAKGGLPLVPRRNHPP